MGLKKPIGSRSIGGKKLALRVYFERKNCLNRKEYETLWVI